MKFSFPITETLFLLLIASCGALFADEEENLYELTGKVSLEIDGIEIKDVGVIVVFLETTDQQQKIRTPSATNIMGLSEVNQRNAQFDPKFMIISVGEKIEFPNDDNIYHNVFSYSKANNFDLGLYPKGASKAVTFDKPGVVNIFCSIHKSMNAKIFVAPNSCYAKVDRDGNFILPNVFQGNYILKTWNDILPETVQEIIVGPDQAKYIEIKIAPQ